MLITLYGINNIGKSTQAKLLTERLKKHGFDAVYLKYPIYDLEPSGPYLNKILRSHAPADAGAKLPAKISNQELQMWFALNRMQFQSHLKELLLDEKIVVAEDYTGTGLAWGTACGLAIDWLEEINAPLIKEDLAILMDGERFLEASEKNHRHESNDDLIDNARKTHLALAKKYNWTVVPANNAIQEVETTIWEYIKLHLPKK